MSSVCGSRQARRSRISAMRSDSVIGYLWQGNGPGRCRHVMQMPANPNVLTNDENYLRVGPAVRIEDDIMHKYKVTKEEDHYIEGACKQEKAGPCIGNAIPDAVRQVPLRGQHFMLH